MYLLEEALIHFFQERVCTFDVTNRIQSTKYFQLITFFDHMIGRQHMIEWRQYVMYFGSIPSIFLSQEFKKVQVSLWNPCPSLALESFIACFSNCLLLRDFCSKPHYIPRGGGDTFYGPLKQVYYCQSNGKCPGLSLLILKQCSNAS